MKEVPPRPELLGTLTAAQRWVLSMGAILREINQSHHDLLAGCGRGAGAGAAVLASWWNIRRRSELHQVLQDLLLPRGDAEAREHPAWDWLRAANVAAWGYDAWMQEADEAWAQMCLAARQVQQTYRSFREAASDYVLGYLADNDEMEMGPTDPVQIAVESLLARGGRWEQLAWDTPLDDVPVPVEPAEVLFARPGDAIAEVLERALARGIDPSRTLVRVELPPGTYAMAVRWEGALELVATGEGVILQGPADGAAIQLSNVHSGIRVEGAQLCAGEGADLAVVEAGQLRLERCALRGDADGFEVHHADAAARLVGCTVEGFATAIWAFGGHTELEDTRFERIADQAVWVYEHATLFMDGCRLEASAGQGVVVEGDARLARTRLERLGQTAIEVKEGGTLALEGCELFDCAGLGLQVHPGSRDVEVEETAFRRAGTYAVQLQTHARFVRCRFEDSRSIEVMVAGCGAELVDCVFQGSGMASIYATGQNQPPSWARAVRLERCLIRDTRTVGVLVLEGGTATLSQVEVIDCQASAVEVRTGGQLRATDCVWRGKGGGALLVHERGTAALTDCRLGAAEGYVAHATSAGRLRLERCRIEGGPQGVMLTGEAVLEALDTTIEGSTEQAGLIVSEGARARIVGGALRGNREVSAYVQLGGLAAFSGVQVEGADLYIVAGGCARLDRCVLRGSDEAGINVDGGYLVFIEGEISGAAYSGMEVKQGGRARVIGASIEQRAGEAAVYAHDGGDVVLSEGTCHSGTSAAIEVTRGARVRLSGTALLAEGVQTATGAPPPLVLAHDGGVFENNVGEVAAELEREPEWLLLTQILDQELVPALADELVEEDVVEDEDEDDVEDGDDVEDYGN